MHMQCISIYCAAIQRGESRAQAAMAAAAHDGAAQLQSGLTAADLTPAMQAVKTKVDAFQGLVDNELKALRGRVHDEYRGIGLQRQVHDAFRGGVPAGKSDKVRSATCLSSLKAVSML